MNTTKQIQLMVALVAVLIAGLFAYTIWEPTRADDALDRQTDEQVERGAKLFGNNCSFCHGLSGEGFVGPALNRPELRPDDPFELKAVQALFSNTIECGRVGSFMPAWAKDQGGPLSGDQIRQLVQFITQGGEEGWERARGFAEEAHVELNQPSPDQINTGACGQVLRATPTPSGPVQVPDAKVAWDVSMGDNFFDPKVLSVPAGQKVVVSLVNSGKAIHNMRIAGVDGRYDTGDDFISNPETFRSGVKGTLTFTFDKAGTFNFRCDFHPVEMTGTITAR